MPHRFGRALNDRAKNLGVSSIHGTEFVRFVTKITKDGDFCAQLECLPISKNEGLSDTKHLKYRLLEAYLHYDKDEERGEASVM